MNIQFISGFVLHATTTHATANCSKDLFKSLESVSDFKIKLAGEVVSSDNYGAKRHDLNYFLKRVIKWPSRDLDVEARCYREMELIHNSDAIIVCHQPYEVVRAAVRYKKKHPGVKMYLCVFDPIASEVDKNLSYSWKILFPLAKRAETQAFKCFDGIFHMECNKIHYQSKRFQNYFKKFHYLDFPVMHNLGKPSAQSECYLNQSIKMIYSGKLSFKYRSPDYLVQVLKCVPQTVEFKMNFYSKGDCEDFLTDLSEQNNRFSACGFVAKIELDAVMEEADVLVNIGNKYSSMLPSKLLSYFEQGKPVIHVSNQSGDACLPYVKKYPLGLVVYESDPIEVSAEYVTEFLCKTYRQRVSSEEVCSLFYRNMPEWSAKEIVKVIQRDSDG